MKSQFVHIVLTAGLTVLGSLALSAQNQYETATIPFTFQVNHKSFAAGDYTLARINSSGVFQVMSKESGRSAFVSAPPSLSGKEHEEGRLTFTCYGGDCVLSQIWLDGSSIGYARSQSSIDKDLPRTLGVASLISVPLKAR